jgi:cytochrome P450 family 6
MGALICAIRSSELLNFNEICSAFSEIDGDLFVAQALMFLLAGYETSASTLTFALYELALHPEIQQDLRAEIKQVLSNHDGKLTYEVVQCMSYLDRVVSGEVRRQDT